MARTLPEKKEPSLKESLSGFMLHSKTQEATEGHQIVSYKNVHEACWITLESL